MGRKPLPNEVKQQLGTFKKNPKRENKQAPSALYGAPQKPDPVVMDEVASDKWDHLVGMLDEMNVLTLTDHDLLARYCLTWSQYMEVHTRLRVVGHVQITEKGSSRSPESQAFIQLNDNLHRMMVELGLYPSSRGKLIANPEAKDNDPFAEWLKKRGQN